MIDQDIQYENCHDIMYYAKKLEDYHQVFYTLVSLNTIEWDNNVETACIEYQSSNQDNNLKIAPDFFDSLNEPTQLFVLAHECLHVIFDHPLRTLKENKNPKLSNIAQDIVINELLFNEFNFDQNQMNLDFDMCLVDTVFTQEQIKDCNIKKDGSFNYYYQLLKKLQPELDNNTNILDPDSHNDIQEIVQKPEQQIWEQIMDGLGSDLDEEERNKIINVMDSVLQPSKNNKDNKPGSQALGQAYNLKQEEQEDNNYWETIVKNQISSLKKKSKAYKEKEHFKTKPRRLTMLSDDMFIPDVHEEEIKSETNDKFDLFFFLDSSGSCIDFAQDFFNLVQTIPEETFNIQLFSFDTHVYELDKDKPKVKGGGGTMFDIIEDAIQGIINDDSIENNKNKKSNQKNNKKRNQKANNNQSKNQPKYPDLVFLLTDGMGNNVQPEKPERWYWILTPFNMQYCIPKKSHKIKIDELKNQNKKNQKMKL